jgi:hypothetical protein
MISFLRSAVNPTSAGAPALDEVVMFSPNKNWTDGPPREPFLADSVRPRPKNGLPEPAELARGFRQHISTIEVILPIYLSICLAWR